MPLRTKAWLLLISAALVGAASFLWRINDWLGLSSILRDVPKPLDRLWLPVLFLLLVVLCWGSNELWKLIIRPDVPSNCPDIDLAWADALTALRQAGIDIKNYPVFLILGRPVGDDDTLFDSANLANNMPLAVRGAPGPMAPVRVYVCLEEKQEAIYVTCPGASVLSAFAERLAPRAGRWGAPAPAPLPARINPMPAPAPNTRERTLQPPDAREGRNLLHGLPSQGLDRPGAPGRPQGLNASATDAERMRLGHLCRLIARDRDPYCGVNGILLAIPFAGTDSMQAAQDTGNACQQDLVTAREALGVHCPVVAVVCDMQSAPGFPEFIEQFEAPTRLPRIGQGCHLLPALRQNTVEEVRGVRRTLAAWICKDYLRRWIYARCRLENEDSQDLTEEINDNSRLFYLLCGMRERECSLATVLEVGFSAYAPVDRLLFGGCYLAATGDRVEHRAFLSGVYDRLIECQSAVYWTDPVRQAEARLDRWIRLGWVALLGLIVVAILVGLATKFSRGQGSRRVVSAAAVAPLQSEERTARSTSWGRFPRG